MQWRDIPGFEGRYQVSDTGLVRSIGTRLFNRVLKPYRNVKRGGYLTVALSNGSTSRSFRLHRLVAMAFLPNPQAMPDVDHINGATDDNRVSNLRWASKSTNGLNRHTVTGAVPFVGVARSISKTNPFRAYIRIGGQQRLIGVFATAELAAEARFNAVKELSP